MTNCTIRTSPVVAPHMMVRKVKKVKRPVYKFALALCGERMAPPAILADNILVSPVLHASVINAALQTSRTILSASKRHAFYSHMRSPAAIFSSDTVHCCTASWR